MDPAATATAFLVTPSASRTMPQPRLNTLRVLLIASVAASALSHVSTLRLLGQETAADEPTVLGLDALSGMPSRIVFGSCGHQDKPMPVLDTIVESDPDLMIYLGDNIYGDSRDMDVLRAKYAKLAAKPEFQRLRAAMPTLSVWDDHDYGENDAGKEYPFKEESKEIFLEFWRVPAGSPRRDHPGIYGAQRIMVDDHVLQIILLDTRTFRDRLARNPGDDDRFKNDYRPDDSPDKTLLGDEQWEWLEARFREPADIRIVASSIQFGHEYNGWESWTNLPAEQQHMFDLIERTRANGVLFISGDVHWGEISRREPWGERGYPLFDVTASGLTESWPSVEPNKYRVGEVVRDNHFGRILIDWEKDDPSISLQILDRAGTVRTETQTTVSTLRFHE